jgi:hypothetical protein
MNKTQQVNPLLPNSACTADWIGQLNGGAIYAYDITSSIPQRTEVIQFNKEIFEDDLKKVCQKVKK